MTQSITDICEGAFSGCDNLSEITLSDNIRHIGKDAFSNTALYNNELNSKLKSINIPPLVSCLEREMLRACSSLTEVRIPKSVAVINQWVFYNCMNLESLIIENEYIQIDGPSIVNCPKLTIYAPKGSSAQDYAFKKKIPYRDVVSL